MLLEVLLPPLAEGLELFIAHRVGDLHFFSLLQIKTQGALSYGQPFEEKKWGVVQGVFMGTVPLQV
jgi:hypothetical protein